MRKYPLTALALSLLLAVSGCGKDEKKEETARTTTPAATTPATTPTETTPTETTPGGTTPEDLNGANDEIAPTVTPEKRFFADTSPWNTRIDGLQPDARSSMFISKASQRVGVIERSGNLPPVTQRRVVTDGVYINTYAWTTPVVRGGENTSLVCRQRICGDNEGVASLPVPADVDPDPRYDGWFTIINADANIAYDLWRARREKDQSISYQFMRKWSLTGDGYNPPNTVSARGSGLPLFAGLIRPKELEAGRIEHALAIAVPGPAQRNYVQPASVTDGNGELDSLPEGARLRLKGDVLLRAKVDPATGKARKLTRQQQRIADTLVYALRHYGAIVVERAAVPTLYAQRDDTSALLQGDELQGLTLSDFEVVTLGKILKDPPLATTDQSGPQSESTP